MCNIGALAAVQVLLFSTRFDRSAMYPCAEAAVQVLLLSTRFDRSGAFPLPGGYILPGALIEEAGDVCWLA